MPLFLALIPLLSFLAHAEELRGISYPRDQCDWIGADGMKGPYLPIGVCKHIFNPNDLSTHADDGHYSHMYACDENGKVESRVWQNDSNCDGDYNVLTGHNYADDFYSCSSTQTPCPHAVIRFAHQDNSGETCGKSSDGWYSEAVDTVYQCLNSSKGWYMLQCTQDGKGLIGIDYDANCMNILNVSVYYSGCNYKDKYIDIMKCDYWDSGADISDNMEIYTTKSVDIAESSSAVDDILDKMSSESEERVQHYDYHSHSHSHSHSHDHHHSSEYHHSHDHHHHGSDSHEHHGCNHGHKHGEHGEHGEHEKKSWKHCLLKHKYMVAGVLGLLLCMCCCVVKCVKKACRCGKKKCKKTSSETMLGGEKTHTMVVNTEVCVEGEVSMSE